MTRCLWGNEMVLAFFYSLVFPFLIGYFFLAWAVPKLSECLRLGLCYGLGMGLIAFWIFLLGAAGIPLTWMAMNLPLCGLAGFMFWRGLCKGEYRQGAQLQVHLSVFEWVMVAFIGVNFIFVFFVATAYPVYSWDAIATVVFKAKVFFFERSFEFNRNLPHASYPFYVSLSHFWISANFAQWNDTAIKILQPCFYGSILFLMYGVLRCVIARTYALLGVCLLVSSMLFQYHAAISYTDIVLAYYTCAALWLIALGYQNGESSFFAVAGLCCGVASFIKLEGAVYSLISIIMVVIGGALYHKNIFSKEQRRIFYMVVLPPVIVFAGYMMFKAVYGVSLGEDGKTIMEFSAGLMGRLGPVLKKLALDFFLTGNWGWNGVIFVFACFAGYRSLRMKHVQYVLLCMAMFIAFHLVLFVFTPNFHWIDKSSTLLSRLILHFFPLMPFTSAILLEQMFQKTVR